MTYETIALMANIALTLSFIVALVSVLPDQIAQVVYKAATYGKEQLRYLAGEDAKATYAHRLQLGVEAFRKEMDHQFFG